jgi:uncharacterized phage protein (TIGR01671 family)
MRTIKFRGKSLDNGEWAYGSLTVAKERCFIQTFNREEEDGLVMCSDPVNASTVGQLTPSKDANNNPIYEGDIVKFENNGAPFHMVAILASDYRWQFCDSPTGEEDCDFLNMADYEKDCVVVSNIHDNPELLKGE